MDSGVRALLARAGQRVLELFGHDENITGVSVGFRRRGGKVTDEPVVTVMVRKKRRPALVSRRRMIPAQIDVDGTMCPTDVIQAQAVLLNANGERGLLPEKYRPLLFGCGVSNFSDARPDAGTLGAIVQDNTDRTTGILSANHVIADNNRAPRNDPIYQPAKLDWTREQRAEEATIGRLKRWVTITGGATAVDAAIAQLESAVRVQRNYNGVEVEPPSETRPAIGMVVAGDGFGNVWLTNMDRSLRELNVTLLPAGSNVERSTPAQWSKIEKVGRTTSYTVARVHATEQRIRVEVPGVGAVEYTNLILTQWFAWNGDSGAMAIKNGRPEASREEREQESIERIKALIRERFNTCEILSAIQFAFNVPITEQETLSNEVRDEFMSQSDTGRLLITLTYLNTPLFRTRLERRQSAEIQASTRALYEHYKPVIAEIMANPESTTRLETGDGLNFLRLLAELQRGGVLTAEEKTAAESLGRRWESTVVGMDRRELLEFMNTSECVSSVRTTSREMRSLTQQGTPRVLGAF